MHGKVGPVIIPGTQSIPYALYFLLPGAPMRNEAPENRKIDNDAIIEIWVPKGSDALNFIKKYTKLLHKELL